MAAQEGGLPENEIGAESGSGTGSNQRVIDDSGAVKITYEVEEGGGNAKLSVLDKLKDRFVKSKDESEGTVLSSSNTTDKESLKPENAYHLAAASPQNIDGSSSKEELQREDSSKRVARGEEMGTGYESDSDSSGLA